MIGVSWGVEGAVTGQPDPESFASRHSITGFFIFSGKTGTRSRRWWDAHASTHVHTYACGGLGGGREVIRTETSALKVPDSSSATAHEMIARGNNLKPSREKLLLAQCSQPPTEETPPPQK